MADYNTLNGGASLRQRKNSSELWQDPIRISTPRAGGVKARRLQESKTYVFEVVHENLTDAEKDSLETFYDANRNGPAFDFAWNDAPGVKYSVIFADEIRWTRDGERHQARVRLAQVI
jgi:hypothetical protein